mgnify:CR=1 FL=1
MNLYLKIKSNFIIVKNKLKRKSTLIVNIKIQIKLDLRKLQSFLFLGLVY